MSLEPIKINLEEVQEKLTSREQELIKGLQNKVDLIVTKAKQQEQKQQQAVDALTQKILEIVNNANARGEKECPICHQKYIPTSYNHKVCNNKHCRLIANATTLKKRCMQERMKQLGKGE